MTSEIIISQKLLRLLEIDIEKSTLKEKTSSQVALDEYSYYLLSIYPEQLAIVVVFTFQQAIWIVSSAGVTPSVKTSTIFMNSPLTHFCQLVETKYLAVDKENFLKFVKFKEVGSVDLIQLKKLQNPSVLVSISSELVFVNECFYRIENIEGNGTATLCPEFGQIKSKGEVKGLCSNARYGFGFFKNEAFRVERKCSFQIEKEYEIGLFERVFVFGTTFIVSNEFGSFCLGDLSLSSNEPTFGIFQNASERTIHIFRVFLEKE
jgi:hypothetical protein